MKLVYLTLKGKVTLKYIYLRSFQLKFSLLIKKSKFSDVILTYFT